MKLEPEEKPDFMVYDDGLNFDATDWIGHEALDEDEPMDELSENYQNFVSAETLAALDAIEEQKPALKKLRKAVRRGRPIPTLGECGSHFVGHLVWVTLCGSHFVGHIVWVTLCLSHYVFVVCVTCVSPVTHFLKV